MEPEINCSELCDSFPGQELDRRPLHDLCRTTIVSEEPGGVRTAQIYLVVVVMVVVVVVVVAVVGKRGRRRERRSRRRSGRRGSRGGGGEEEEMLMQDMCVPAFVMIGQFMFDL